MRAIVLKAKSQSDKIRSLSPVTMQDIADTLGITKVSVSKAINNQPGVGDELREKILQTSARMGYKPIRRTISAKARRFAFVCPKRFFLEDDSFYTTIFYYVNKRSIQNGESLHSFIVNDRDEVSLKLPVPLTARRFDGIYIAGQFQESFLDRLFQLSGCKIAIDFYRPQLETDSVITENYRLGQLVTERLIQSGHRNIGFVGDPSTTSSIGDRYSGYRRMLEQHNLPFDKSWVLCNNDALTGAYHLNCNLPAQLPTAFVCHCDKAAFMLKQQLEQAGRRVPQDVSLISFDNTRLATLLNPGLTSVDFDRRMIADAAVQLLHRRLNTPDMPPQVVYIKGELQERGSVGSVGPAREVS